ncbi:kinesin-like protein KIF21A isoform X2 [Lineus longissimus]|uniref:kinesin-like protein KIF21A isoform X2 n=1 Tax=Lineus longissimus TaxID=88925 RepID=UPI00315D29E5
MEKGDDESSVRVALRIRPKNAREKIDACQMCTQVTPGEPQVLLGKDKAFTYDNVFDITSTQEMLYNMCARSLIEGCLEGYNATIFAYGQTGAGKTYSMGTGFDVNASPEEIGIIPRAVDHLFQGIEARKNQARERNETPPDFKVTAQFMELYNEEIIDLLDTTRDPSERNKKSHIKIHEDAGGGIYTVGVTTRPVASMQDTMHCLKVGALCRTTASTNMNSQSSRSHAIFTLHVKQQRVVPAEAEGEEVEGEEEEMVQRDSSPQLCEFEMLTAKFHFVDLAGSERLKRTGATGDRAKEGISINCGLLALGNVISALGDKMKRGCHVPYRDSKLTRLLQDSLGGNSRTVMIACVSPCDRDFMETLNTLKYANRARNIQNKVTVNQDKTSKQIAAMRMEIKLLQEELMEYKQGRRVVDGDGVETINDMFHENTMLQTENNNLRKRIKAMQETIENLNAKNVQLLSERALQNITNISGDASQDEISKLIQGYIQEIEELRTKLVESEALCETLRKQSARSPSSRSTSSMGMSMGLSTPMQSMGGFGGYDVNASHDDQVEDILELAKQDLQKLKKKTYSRQSSKTKSHGSIKEEPSDNDKDINEAEDDENVESQEKSDEDVSDEEMEADQEEVEVDLGEESSEDSDIEDQDSDNIHEDLAELTCEISIKQKLIEELEVSQKRLQTLRHQYEEKLNLLQAKIKDTEVERDTVLTSLGKVEVSSGDQVKKVKSQYQKKLDEMQAEVKKLQAAKKEHSKLLRNQAHYEKQLKTLQHDLTEMKKTKVRLMSQIKEEAKRNKVSESRTHKEIAQLKKDQRQREVQIKNLESAKRQKEIILKRKQEEVEQLRKRPVRNMSARVAGRTGRYNYPLPVSNNKQPTSTITNNNNIKPPTRIQRRRSNRDFSSKAAKQKWDAVEKSVNGIVQRKQTVSHMEKDMNTWLKEREKLVKKVEKLSRKRQEAVVEEKDEQFLVDLDFEIENLHSRLEEAQDNISECQSNIMELMEIKDEDAMAMINTCTLDEARYLLEHLLGFAINKGLSAAQKETETKELTVKLGKVKRHNSFHYSLLQYVMHQSNAGIEIEDEWLNRPPDEVSESDSDSSSSETSGYDRYLDSFLPESTSTPNILEAKKKKEKARRKTATTEDLLYAGTNPSEGAKPLLPLAEPEDPHSPRSSTSPLLPENDEKVTDPLQVLKQSLSLPKDPMAVPKGTKHGGILGLRESLEKFTQELPVPKQQAPSVADSALMPPPKGLPLTRANPSLVTTETANSRPEPSPAMRRKAYNNRSTPEPSPQMRRRNTNAMSRQNSLWQHPLFLINNRDRGSDAEGPTPPGSPTASRRSSVTNPIESSDVFSRLTGSRSSSPSNNSGSINPNTKLQSSKSCPLVCTHKAEGHTKAVLSVCATDDLLFSSSKDRSAKVWDLNTGQEVATLAGHPNNVTCVKYCEASHLAFTVSAYFTKLWDIRDNNKCVKTLCSSGQSTNGPLATAASSSRQVGLPLGEMMINDIAHNRQGTMLFSAAGNLVRLWDLRRFLPVGKLSGGHQAAIMTLTVEEDEQVTVVTGSKDHYIKVFQMPQTAIGVLTPKYNLEPPHYDGIQCLAMTGNVLFSGSRDNCIKKWDVAEQQLKQSLNSAHKDWVCGLAFMPGGNCLLSCCRGGYLKLWHVDSCMQIGEIKAHTSPVNAITTNSSSVFTASNDLTVGIWRARSIDNSDSCQSDNDERDRATSL